MAAPAAAPCEQPAYTVEVHFAQRLAANEKKIRERAVKRLRQWIGARSRKDTGVEEAELMKLWKGLFYCMWMCDKPVVQEELADQVSDMVHCFHQPDQAVLFYDTFLLTMKREWMGIDHLRMDKYLMLVRRSFRQMLVLLHNNDWDDTLMERFLDGLRRTALNPDVDACPDGLRYQIANVFLDELAREGTEDLSPQKASMFLVPFAELAGKTLNKKLRDVVLDDIFQDIVERSHVGEEEEEEEDEGIASDEEGKKKQKSRNAPKNKRKRKEDVDEDEDGEEEEEEEVEDDADILEKVMFPEEMVPPLEYDYGFISEKLFDLASSTGIPPRNRKPMYKMVQRFQSLAKGVYPMPNLLEEIRNEKDNEYLKDELPWWKKLQAREIQKKRRRKRRRGKKGGGGDGEEEEEGGEGDGEAEEGVVKKKRKKTADATEGTPEDMGKDTTSGKKDKKKKKKKQGDADIVMEDANEQENSEATEKSTGDSEVQSKPSSKKSKGKKKKTSPENVGDSAVSKDITADDEIIPKVANDASSLSSKKTKKNKKEKRKSNAPISVETTASGADASVDAAPENRSSDKKSSKKSKKSKKATTDLSPVIADGASASVSSEDNLADISMVLFKDSSSVVSASLETPLGDSKKKKKGKKNKSKGGSDESQATGASPKDDSVQISLSSPQVSGSKEEQVETPKQFASFQKVETPMAYVKKSKVKQAAAVPSTLPRAKAKSQMVSKYTPPMTRKRVKIALSKNESQAAHEYKQRVKLSPGVPFDGSKKPTHSVLKQTPKKSADTPSAVKGSAKTKKRRSQATDFF